MNYYKVSFIYDVLKNKRQATMRTAMADAMVEYVLAIGGLRFASAPSLPGLICKFVVDYDKHPDLDMELNDLVREAMEEIIGEHWKVLNGYTVESITPNANPGTQAADTVALYLNRTVAQDWDLYEKRIFLLNEEFLVEKELEKSIGTDFELADIQLKLDNLVMATHVRLAGDVNNGRFHSQVANLRSHMDLKDIAKALT